MSDRNDKRQRSSSPTNSDAAPIEEVKKSRERRSRFSDKTAVIVEPQQEPTVIATDITSIQNARLMGMNPAMSALLGNVDISQQQTVSSKESRELFVGNVLATISDVVLKEFLNSAMRHVGLSTCDPIVTCRMNAKFSFIELRTPEDSTLALNLNGIPFMGQNLKISRPSKYVGPLCQSKTWQELTGQIPAQGIQSSSSDTAIDPSTKTFREVFIGNTSPEMTDISIKEFLGGALQQMGLSCSGSENPVVQIRVNGKFSFAEFRTMEDAANALNLNGIPFMSQLLKLSRPSKFEATTLASFFTWEELYSRSVTGELKLLTSGTTSRVIRISNMVSHSDLEDADLTAEVVEDTISECSQFGKVLRVIIPRPEYQGHSGKHQGFPSSSGIGKAFVEMSCEEEAKLTLVNLKGRKFDGKWVDVKFYPLDAFSAAKYDAILPNNVVTTGGAVTIEKVIMPRPGYSIPGISNESPASSAVSAMLSTAGIGFNPTGGTLSSSKMPGIEGVPALNASQIIGLQGIQ
jgi:splicing factor U2AF subunit